MRIKKKTAVFLLIGVVVIAALLFLFLQKMPSVHSAAGRQPIESKRAAGSSACAITAMRHKRMERPDNSRSIKRRHSHQCLRFMLFPDRKRTVSSVPDNNSICMLRSAGNCMQVQFWAFYPSRKTRVIGMREHHLTAE